jgi:DNA-directed RNA polymerase subunit M/transcription elongation factor TFIIS
MHKCPKCGTEMEAKGELEDSSEQQSIFLQCPKCKNIELKAKQFNHWFSLDYP